MLIRHGGIAIDIPQGWTDASTLLFVPPPSGHGGSNVVDVRTADTPQEAVSVVFVTEPGLDPKRALHLQAQQLLEEAPGFEIMEEGAFSCALGDGWRMQARFEVDDVPVVQVAVACALGASLVVATAVAGASVFPRLEAELQAVLTSLRRVEF